MSDGELTLDDYEATLPPERLAAIDRDYHKLLQRVRDLQAIRDLVGQSQTELAARMGTNQGALSRLERKTDFALRILRRFVRQLGGELDIVVRLPGRPPIRLDRLSDASDR